MSVKSLTIHGTNRTPTPAFLNFPNTTQKAINEKQMKRWREQKNKSQIKGRSVKDYLVELIAHFFCFGMLCL